MQVPYGMATLHVLYVSYFRESIGQTMFVSFELLSPYAVDYLHLMITLEQFMDGWISEHLAYGGSLSHVDVTNEGGEEL